MMLTALISLQVLPKPWLVHPSSKVEAKGAHLSCCHEDYGAAGARFSSFKLDS